MNLTGFLNPYNLILAIYYFSIYIDRVDGFEFTTWTVFFSLTLAYSVYCIVDSCIKKGIIGIINIDDELI